MSGPGPVLDVAVSGTEVDDVVSAWRARATKMLESIGWRHETLHVRKFADRVSLAFSAPIDVLYSACEVNEWALGDGEPEDFEDARERILAEIADESNPKLRALQRDAAAHDVAFLWDDDHTSVGCGTGCRTWITDRLPDPKDVPWDQVHDIPVVMVTGTNGKSTTVRLLASIVEAAGKVPGISSTDSIRVGDDTLDTGDYSGPGGARAVLRDPRCDVAILETARGGMLRRGVGYERAQAVTVLNVAQDHLGEFGIQDLAGLVEAKFLIEHGLAPTGTLVLNADEPPVVTRGNQSHVATKRWFGLGAARNEGANETAFVRDGTLVLDRGGREEPVIAEADIPITFGGKARFNTSNALAAVVLADCIGIPVAAMRQGLAQFDHSPERNPGRSNLFRIDGFTVIADFAHNAHGAIALFDMAKAFKAPRVAVLLGQAGDRSDAEVRALVEATWAARPDLIVVKAMHKYLRGRPVGEMVQLIDAELARAGVPTERVEHADTELQAAERALAWAQPGDLLLLPLHAQRTEILELLTRRAEA